VVIQELNVDDMLWPELLQTVTYDFYHLPGYTLLEARRSQGKPVGYLIRESTADQDRWLFIPAILRPIPSSDLLDLTTAYGYPGPLWGQEALKDLGFAQWAITTWLNHLRASGIVSAFLRFHPLFPQPESLWQQHEHVLLVNHGETVSIDLTLSLEQLWRQTRKGHRYEIRQMQKRNDTSVFMDEDWSFFDEFLDCYAVTMDRVDATEHYYFPREFFVDLREVLGPNLHLCVACIGDDVASASLFTETCCIVQYHLSGSRPQYVSVPTSKLILHYVRSWAKHRGNSVFHLGTGVGGKVDGVFSFKAGFSPSRHPLNTWRAIIDQNTYCVLLNERRYSVGLSSSATLNLDGFFPEYRSSSFNNGHSML
jgi:hypothetical protein